MPFVTLGSRRIEYSVVNGTSRRYTYFRFRSDLTLEVVLPRGRRVDVEKALSERAPWLRSQYERLSKTRSVLTRDSVTYGGVQLKIVVAEGTGDGLAPDLEKGEVVVRSSDPRHVRELIRRWFLKESSSYAVKKVRELAPGMGARPSRVDVREIGKWGYCTRNGRLSFSWQLIALPERLREYVVMHELTHLFEFNHSIAFRRKLASICPDFRAREKELDLVVPYDRLALG
ncbi:MAG TPA: SprT family zinc-dependent metalloprotease [Nitrososphaerales archaeon]|nr:SprT family zinc-dependent metalloprotease [Nitrososphaerales archaeon]